jgi:Zn finger protein HypA/HybF involved in hydrogenase expression
LARTYYMRICKTCRTVDTREIDTREEAERHGAKGTWEGHADAESFWQCEKCGSEDFEVMEGSSPR